MKIIKFNLNDVEKQNTNFAYYILGRSYDLEENGAPQNYNVALYYYSKGFKNGYPLCEYSLGISYELGLGNVLKVDKVKAKKILKQAYPKIIDLINDENTDEIEKIYAKFITGAYYYFGLGDIKKDYEKAFEIIKDCADHGHIAAIYDLGANFYYNGNGTKINMKLSNYYLNIAKEAGLPRAIALSESRRLRK